MPDTQPKIYAKLLEFQKQHVGVKKEGTNTAFGRGFSYATLNDVHEAVKKPLNDLGVLIIHLPGETGLTTRLVAVEDGSSVESFFPYVNPSDAQKQGGNITYGKRYNTVALLALEEEDDDGNAASGAAQPAPSYQARPQPFPAASPAPQPAGTKSFKVVSIDEKVSAKGTRYATLATDLDKQVVLFGKSVDKVRQGGSYSAPFKLNDKGDTYMLDGYEDAIRDLDQLPF